MIGQCKHCGDPGADLKLNKTTGEVVCANKDCLAVKEDATPFFKAALKSQRDYLASGDAVVGNTIFCSSCGVNSGSIVLKRKLADNLRFKDLSNEDRYIVKCSVCETEKNISSFMLNALVETLNVQQQQVT